MDKQSTYDDNIFYHVTAEENYWSIRDHGLTPTNRSVSKPHFYDYPVSKSGVYLSGTLSMAIEMANRGPWTKYGKNPIILEVRNIDLRRLVPDHEELAHFLDSLSETDADDDSWDDIPEVIIKLLREWEPLSANRDAVYEWAADAMDELTWAEQQELTEFYKDTTANPVFMYKGVIPAQNIRIINPKFDPMEDETDEGDYVLRPYPWQDFGNNEWLQWLEQQHGIGRWDDFYSYEDFLDEYRKEKALRFGPLLSAHNQDLLKLGASQHQSAWVDVMAKAKRLILDNKVILHHKTLVKPEHSSEAVIEVGGQVIGDHGVYNTRIWLLKDSPRRARTWTCECLWERYVWNRSPAYKRFEGRLCVLPGSLVTMADGSYKPIEEVRAGDEVLTHNGIGKVAWTQNNQYDGPVYHIYRTGSPYPISVTENHEVYAVKTPNKVRYASYNVTPGKNQGFRIHDDSYVYEGAEWIDSQDLQVHDWVSCAVSQEVGETPSNDLAVVLGYYIAEGNLDSTGREVQWTLHKDETRYQEELKGALERLGYKWRQYGYDSRNTVSIRVSSRPLAELLVSLGGRYAREKKFAPEVMLWHPDVQRTLLLTLWNGDGYSNKDGRKGIYTASEMLARQMFDIVNRVGWIPSMSSYVNNLGPNNRSAGNRIWCVKFKMHDKKKGNGRRIISDTEYMAKINKIKQEWYSGLVYNFHVEGQESYVINGVTTHNCSHTLGLYWSSIGIEIDNLPVETNEDQMQFDLGPEGEDLLRGAIPPQPKIPNRMRPDELGVKRPGESQMSPQTQMNIPGLEWLQHPSQGERPDKPVIDTDHNTLEELWTTNPFDRRGPENPVKQGPDQPKTRQRNRFRQQYDMPNVPWNKGKKKRILEAPPKTMNKRNTSNVSVHFSFEEGDWQVDPFDELHKQIAMGIPTYARVLDNVMGERRGGLMPHPDAEPTGMTADGNFVYGPGDLGWDGTDMVDHLNAPEERGTYGEIPRGAPVRVLSVHEKHKMALIRYDFNLDPPNHQYIETWVPIKDLALS